MNFKLPVMLLKGFVILPNQEVKLELNNKLSKKVITLAYKNCDKKLLVVCPNDQIEETPDVGDLPSIGVVAIVKSRIELPNGNLRITLKGVERVAVLDYNNHEEDKNVLESTVTKVILPKFAMPEEEAVRRKLIELMHDYVNSADHISNSILKTIDNITSLFRLTDIITSFMPFSISKKLEYMQEINALYRAKNLIKDISIELQIIALDRQIDENLRDSIEESQKEFILKEKIREIKKELGEESSKDEEVEEYLAKLNSLRLPTKTYNKILKEIKKFEMTSEMSPEISIIRNYLDLILDLPWNIYSEDETDIKKIRESLDKTHYGLEKIKDRITEYVAIKKRNPELKSPIICLVGPPGVGKTSFAMGVASALNKEFYKISVGGLNDSAELVGHRKTYIGASPGRIISGIRKCGTSNPVLLIDEVDKLVKDYKGDPASSLLDILDPEQNKEFVDNYIEEPFDLSKVLFILTANDEANIPSALIDRLEIIDLSSYTEFQKIDIAKKYLLPIIFNEHKVTNKEIKISDDVIAEIIKKYTKESGVRELNRLLNTIIRKIVVNSTEEKIKKVVKKSDLVEFLGQIKYDESSNISFNVTGLVNGLAYTPYGGLVLPIEVSSYEGDGKFEVTGMLGQAMNESVNVALSYIKSNKDYFKINDYYFKTKDIHIHFLEGAIKKDGPSAGVAITTAIISLLLNKKIDKSIAMTGEISLKGNVLKIGGLKEKIIGAYNSNIKTVIIPKSNHADLEDVPDKVKEKLKIVEVSTYNEIYNLIFNKDKA